ncbi:MAG: AbrB/MazE/SpoVT family DNA-binding domain-containing protein [Nevskiaceae bacterium]|nr:MAG: AbrB/MazE/SpoVT family DNA-binding domain-containing protein [Nevskiaceae bacterium]TBR75294.1 MAG: AbrB/MazE/SpoVT family DNA-binding domain-containing protein [Nevskiaceae bacterium]
MQESVKVTGNGRIVIPSAVRKRLQIKSGDELLLDVGNGELRLRTVPAAIAQAQARLRRYVKTGQRLSDELIQDRRAEAERD